MSSVLTYSLSRGELTQDSSRSLRRELQRYFPQSVPAECCHCGRPLGHIYGDGTRARHYYIGGQVPDDRGLDSFEAEPGPGEDHIPVDAVAKVTWFPVKITCTRHKPPKNYETSQANFNAAYRAALAKPKGQRVLRLPDDLKTVTRGEPAVRLDRPLIGR